MIRNISEETPGHARFGVFVFYTFASEIKAEWILQQSAEKQSGLKIGSIRPIITFYIAIVMKRRPKCL